LLFISLSVSGFSVSAFCFELLGISIAYSTRSQSSNVRRICGWREVILI